MHAVIFHTTNYEKMSFNRVLTRPAVNEHLHQAATRGRLTHEMKVDSGSVLPGQTCKTLIRIKTPKFVRKFRSAA
jgi:hypothetical protein